MYNICIYNENKKIKHKYIIKELESAAVLKKFTYDDYSKYLDFRKQLTECLLTGGESQLINSYLKNINEPRKCCINNKIKMQDDEFVENFDTKDKLGIYEKNLPIIKKILSNESHIKFKYYKEYLGEKNLCPICGSIIRKNYMEHYYPKAKFNLFSDRLYNIHICCDFCNIQGKDIDFHPYFMMPIIELKSVSFILEERSIKIDNLILEEDKRKFKLMINNNKLSVEIKGKKKLLELDKKNDDIRGIYVGFLYSLQELEIQLKDLYYIKYESNVKINLNKQLKSYVESFNGNKLYWKYQVMLAFCEQLLEGKFN